MWSLKGAELNKSIFIMARILAMKFTQSKLYYKQIEYGSPKLSLNKTEG